MSALKVFLVIIMPTAQTLMVVSSVNATVDILAVDYIALVSEIRCSLCKSRRHYRVYLLVIKYYNQPLFAQTLMNVSCTRHVESLPTVQTLLVALSVTAVLDILETDITAQVSIIMKL